MTIDDRLARARARRSIDIEVAGEKLKLWKWNLDQTLAHTSLLFDVLKGLVTDKNPDAIKKFLNASTAEILKRYSKELKDLLADSITKENFKDKAEALLWIEEITIEELMELLFVVWKENVAPFAARLGLDLPALKEKVQTGIRSVTSSQSSSKQDTILTPSTLDTPEKK